MSVTGPTVTYGVHHAPVICYVHNMYCTCRVPMTSGRQPLSGRLDKDKFLPRDAL